MQYLTKICDSNLCQTIPFWCNIGKSLAMRFTHCTGKTSGVECFIGKVAGFRFTSFLKKVFH